MSNSSLPCIQTMRFYLVKMLLLIKKTVNPGTNKISIKVDYISQSFYLFCHAGHSHLLLFDYGQGDSGK